MTQYLPCDSFKWMSEKEIYKFDLASIKEDSPNVYILEVDLEYPNELHNIHNDYLLPQKTLKLIKICYLDIVLIFLINME